MNLNPPSESRSSCSEQRNNKWLCRAGSGFATFDVFKREYWPHLPRYLTKGIGVSPRSSLSLLLYAHSTHHAAPSVAFGEIIGAAFEAFYVLRLSYGCPGTIKGSEKSLEFPNRALDKDTYEGLTNRNYALFEAYQKLKRERHERDIADRYTLVHIQHVQPVTYLFQI